MKKIILIISIVFAISLMFNSCYKDSVEGLYRFTCDTTNVTYSGTIQAIISTNCLGCHDAGNSNGDFTTQALVASKGNAIVGRITGQTGNIMPQGGKLDDCSINKIKAWVNKGAPNN